MVNAITVSDTQIVNFLMTRLNMNTSELPHEKTNNVVSDTNRAVQAQNMARSWKF